MNYIEKILLYKGIEYLHLSFANMLLIIFGLYVIGKTAYKTKKLKHSIVLLCIFLIIVSILAKVYNSSYLSQLPLWMTPQMVIPASLLIIVAVVLLGMVQKGSAKISKIVISLAVSTLLSGGYMYAFSHANTFMLSKYLPFVPNVEQVVKGQASSLGSDISGRIKDINLDGNKNSQKSESIDRGKVGDKTPTQSLSASVLSANVRNQLGGEVKWNGHGAFTVSGNKTTLNANINSAPYATNSPVNSKGQLGVANAWLNKSSRQYKNRSETGNAKTTNPAGYIQRKVGKEYLYNRGHLLGYALVGNIKSFDASEANPKNIATQTEWSNQSQSEDSTGQNYFESLVRKALDNNKQVRYRVTPIYDGGIVPVGNHIEAKSKDGSLEYNVFVPNVEPSVQINYADGNSVIK